MQFPSLAPPGGTFCLAAASRRPGSSFSPACWLDLSYPPWRMLRKNLETSHITARHDGITLSLFFIVPSLPTFVDDGRYQVLANMHSQSSRISEGSDGELTRDGTDELLCISRINCFYFNPRSILPNHGDMWNRHQIALGLSGFRGSAVSCFARRIV